MRAAESSKIGLCIGNMLSVSRPTARIPLSRRLDSLPSAYHRLTMILAGGIGTEEHLIRWEGRGAGFRARLRPSPRLSALANEPPLKRAGWHIGRSGLPRSLKFPASSMNLIFNAASSKKHGHLALSMEPAARDGNPPGNDNNKLLERIVGLYR